MGTRKSPGHRGNGLVASTEYLVPRRELNRKGAKKSCKVREDLRVPSAKEESLNFIQ